MLTDRETLEEERDSLKKRLSLHHKNLMRARLKIRGGQRS